jgi:anti-anti-sigma factor
MSPLGEPLYVKEVGELVVRALRADEVVIVEIVGPIDLGTAPLVEEAVELVAGLAPKVVVNLSDVNYLDSSVLNTLIRTQRKLAEREVALLLVKPNDQNATRIFDISALPADLIVVASLDAALAQIA